MFTPMLASDRWMLQWVVNIITHQNLEKWLHLHKKDIDKVLVSNSSNYSFDSTLACHIFNNTSHTILFEKSGFISSAATPPPKALFTPNKFHWNLETNVLFKIVQRTINNAFRLDKKKPEQRGNSCKLSFRGI